MTRTEIDLINTPRRCPVMAFVKRYLMRDSASDATSQEILKFYAEVAASGELEQLSKSELLRRLPGAMASIFGARKSHDIKRDGQKVRGFRGVVFRLDTSPPLVVELEPEAV